MSHQKSQRELIKAINEKLNGWAAYHRFGDAEKAFKRIDTAVQAALLEKSCKQHPKLPMQKVISRYWYKDIHNKSYYALPDDKTVRVIKLSETVLVHHNKIKTNANPYTEREYIEARNHFREIHNVTGKYKGIWKGQEGKCYYCGKPRFHIVKNSTGENINSRLQEMLNSKKFLCHLYSHDTLYERPKTFVDI